MFTIENFVLNCLKRNFYEWAICGFIQDESIELPGTCFSLYEVATDNRFPEEIHTAAKELINMFGQRSNIADLLTFLSVFQGYSLRSFFHEMNDGKIQESVEQEKVSNSNHDKSSKIFIEEEILDIVVTRLDLYSLK